MSVHDIAESGARHRTRRAIVEAAIGVISDNPTAPLSEIAEAAGVGRSTLHRYFPERTDLLRAVALEVAAAALDKLIGKAPSEKDLSKVIDQSLEDRG